ncbi:12721_t:CDS:2, partial [Acaulospora morrowiae]
DEHPPLPESASPIVKDFLMQCFQKDSNLRVSARKLLKHPWITNVQKKAADTRLEPRVSTDYDEVVESVKKWNEALKGSHWNPPQPPHGRRRSESLRLAATMPRIQFQQSLQLSGSSSPIPKISLGNIDNINAQQSNRLSVTVEPEDEENNNWDDDFVDSIPYSKIAEHQNRKLGHKSSEEDQTIRLTQTKNEKKNKDKGKKPMVNKVQKEEENFTEETVIEDTVRLTSGGINSNWESTQETIIRLPKKIMSPKENAKNNNGIALSKSPVPIDDKQKNSTRPEQPVIKTLKQHARAHSANYAHESSINKSPLLPLPTQKSVSSTVSATATTPSSRRTPLFKKDPRIEIPDSKTPMLTPPPSSPSGLYDDSPSPSEIYQYRESDDDDDYNNIFRNESEDDEDGSNHTLKLNTRLSNKSNSWLRDDPSESEERLVFLCVQITELLIEHKNLKNHFIIFHGVIPIMEMLEICSYNNVLSRLLKIVNIIIEDNISLQENLCLVGGIPIIMNFTLKRYPYEIRVEAAIFIRHICHTSPIVLQMFIACRGLKVLVEFLQEDYNEHKELAWIAVNGISGVFELQSPTPKNDFCRLLAKNGLLDPLALTLHSIIAENDPSAKDYMERIVNIFSLFSQGDAYVKEVMATRTRVVTRIFEVLDKLPQDLMVIMLKCIKNISMNSNTLEALQKAKTIQVLTAIMDKQEAPYITEIANQVLNTMYNLCRINKSRQEEAAKAGLIPHLQYFASKKTPLKQFALPILCDMAHTGQVCRDLLWKHNVLQLYLDLLIDPYWQVNALEAIIAWFQEETYKVEQMLIEPRSIDLMLGAFVTAKANSFESILEPFHLLMQLSKDVTCALAQPNFFKRLLQRLGHPKPVVRLNLLRVLKTVCDVYPQRETVIQKYDLIDVILKMSKDDPAVLIREKAKEILSQGYFSPKDEVSPESSATPIEKDMNDEIFVVDEEEQEVIQQNIFGSSDAENNSDDNDFGCEGINEDDIS